MAKNKPAAAKKTAPKPAAKKPAPAPAKPAPKPAAKAEANGKPAKSSPTMEKPSKKNALRDSILKRKAAAKPIAFSLDEVRAIAKTVTSKTNSPFPAKTAAREGGSAVRDPRLQSEARPRARGAERQGRAGEVQALLEAARPCRSAP